MRRQTLALLIPLLIAPRVASAQGEPLGPQFRVNTSTPTSQGESSVATTGGDFVVVWEDHAFGVSGQRFDSAGSPLGTQFRVNTNPDGGQLDPAVAANASGFVVAWQRQILVIPEPFPIYTWSGFGQRFDSAGNPLGTEFRVNGPFGSYQNDTGVAVAPSGAFLVVWYSAAGQAPPGPGNVSARRYDSSGVPQGPEFLVNTYTPFEQGHPSVAADPAGNFVVAWSSQYSANDWDVIGQRYAASGEPLGPQFRVNTYKPGFQSGPAVATDPSGNFVVAWSSESSGNPPEPGLFAQRFASSGAPLGAEFRVNTSTTVGNYNPAIAVDSGGNFVITWVVAPSFGTGDVFGQRFSSLGEPSGPEFRVNTSTPGWERNPSIASTPNGTFLVTWDSGPVNLISDDVYGQRFGGVFPIELQDFRLE